MSQITDLIVDYLMYEVDPDGLGYKDIAAEYAYDIYDLVEEYLCIF